MKTRHLILGLAAVLALSLAVPALGSSLSLRLNDASKVKLQVKRAKTVLSGAQGVARAAQATAGDAQDKATAAQVAANGAKSAAAGAQGTSEAATVKVESAETTADAARTTAETARSRGGEALSIAKGAFLDIAPVSQPGDGEAVKTAIAECPEGSFVTGGGYVVGGDDAGSVTPIFSEPVAFGDGAADAWEVGAVSLQGQTRYLVKAWAMCTFKEPAP